MCQVFSKCTISLVIYHNTMRGTRSEPPLSTRISSIPGTITELNLYPVMHPFHWFWNAVPWAQTVKHILLFLSTSHGPWLVSKGSLSGAEDYRGSDIPGNAGARRTPTMPWVKIWGKRKSEAFCHREPINFRVWRETQISHIWDYEKK